MKAVKPAITTLLFYQLFSNYEAVYALNGHLRIHFFIKFTFSFCGGVYILILCINKIKQVGLFIAN